jgi:uncharacterized protein (TIGR02246 family)
MGRDASRHKVITPHCSSGETLFDLSNADRQAIEQVHDRWIAEELADNSMAVLQLCTDDVIWIPPNFPALVGKEVIRQWLSAAEVEIRELHIANRRIDGEGSVAYLTSNYSTAYITGGSAVIAKADGTHLWILRKRADGEWKVAIITWSSWEASR